MNDVVNPTVVALIAARSLIERPERWTQGYYARDILGKHVSTRSQKAFARCAKGAILADNTDIYYKAYVALEAVIKRFDGDRRSISDWNDAPGRTHAEVLAMFDLAIERAGAEVTG